MPRRLGVWNSRFRTQGVLNPDNPEPFTAWGLQPKPCPSLRESAISVAMSLARTPQKSPKSTEIRVQGLGSGALHCCNVIRRDDSAAEADIENEPDQKIVVQQGMQACKH